MKPDVDSLERNSARLLGAFAGNSWFTNTHWPENQARIRMMVEDISARYPDGGRVLDVGCFNGYASLLMAWSGYSVMGTDMEDLPDRTSLFSKYGVDFHQANLNESDPFHFIPPQSVDAVLLGEVIEHVLNHPVGLLCSIGRVLKSNGLLILSTPNPSNFMNATRVLLGRPLLWGTQSFVSTPKVDGESIICKADIHYREYTTSEMQQLLLECGYSIESIRYMGMGVSRSQPPLKRMLKNFSLFKWLMTHRLFACTQYFVAQKANHDGTKP